jgi:hypothetical protein
MLGLEGINVAYQLHFKINHLQAENTRLANELFRCKDEAHAEILGPQHAEEKFGRLEGDLFAARVHESALKRENMHLSSKIKLLMKRIGHGKFSTACHCKACEYAARPRQTFQHPPIACSSY